MAIIFSAVQKITVSHNADGPYSWSGKYGGVDIKCALPSNDGKRCVLLLDPDAMQRPTFENLLCIDELGLAIWVARLPESSDFFLSVDHGTEGLRAATWSGWKLILDSATGAELKRTFVK